MPVLKDARRGMSALTQAMGEVRNRKALAGALAQRAPLPAGRYRIGVYFADGVVDLYQLRQWFRPLAELAGTWPVLVLSRDAATTAILLEECPLPVAYVRSVSDLERTIDEQDLRVIFYVNQSARNFQMMRYGARWHVFINHGESDKAYMTTNQVKAYDYALVAGDAARARLSKALWDYDVERRTIPIGRPQADYFSSVAQLPSDSRDVVLYAPTWEGDRDSAAYSSVVSHGPLLVEALLATGRHRVVYRPHPRTGQADAAHAAAHRSIVAALAAANAHDPGGEHIYDTGSELGWQLAAADLAIVDVSAMIYDRLAVGKPLLVTRPASEQALVDLSGYLAECEWLDAADAGRIVDVLDRLEHDEAAAERLAGWVRHYFGDTSPGAATARFRVAVQHLMDEWERHAELHGRAGG